MVVAWFGSAGVVAYDMNGKKLWQRDLGRQRHTWGYAASPMIAGGRVFLNFGPGDRAFLVALDQASGKTLWQVDVPPGKGAKFANWSAEDMYGSWSTPLMVGGELIVSHPKRLVAYDPATGKERWAAEVMGDLVYPSPVFGEGVLVAASGFGGPIAAVKPGGEVLWRQEKWKPQIGSGVITGGHLYVVDNGGIAHCVKLPTGEIVWSKRLLSDGEDNGVWASPVLIDGKVLVTNKSGRTFVFAAKPEFELFATNNVGEATNSSLAAAPGDIILRTHEALWCFTRKSN
jgi:outer membrane protein assembly factor BamB